MEVGGVGVEAVFGEDCGAEGVAEDVEVFFVVGIAVGGVCAEFHLREVFGCGLCELFGEGVGAGLAFGGVDAPAGGGGPFFAVAVCVGVDGDEDDVFFAVCSADGVCSPAAFRERDVGFFGDEEACVVAFVFEVCDEVCCYGAVEAVFEEASVGAAFASCGEP